VGLSQAEDCLAVLFVLALLNGATRSYFREERIRTHIAEMAFRAQYSGRWMLVQEILELPNKGLYFMLEKVLQYRSSNAIFGNLTSRIGWVAKHLRAKKAFFDVTKDPRPVKFKQRRRGYDDKGTLPDRQRLSLEYYRVIQEVQIDRRDKIRKLRSECEWGVPVYLK
jgi:hypothetical protein